MVCKGEVTIVTMAGMKHEAHYSLIDELGGTVEVARLCQVSSQAVSKWRNDGIPPARLMYLRLACKDVFEAWEARQRAAEAAEETPEGATHA